VSAPAGDGGKTPLDAAVRRCVGVANGIGLVALVAMTLVTVVDVAGRYLLNRPLPGALELSELLMVFLVFGCFAYTELQNGHVDVDVLVNRFPPWGRAVCEALAALLSAGFWGVVAWRTAVRALDIRAAGETSTILGLPIWPFVGIAAAGSVLFTFVLLYRRFDVVRRLVRS
jgi:TRAP-type C4-dicarboxylate transport system permease small subunit